MTIDAPPAIAYPRVVPKSRPLRESPLGFLSLAAKAHAAAAEPSAELTLSDPAQPETKAHSGTPPAVAASPKPKRRRSRK